MSMRTAKRKRVRCPHCQKLVKMRIDKCLPRHKQVDKLTVCEGSGGFYLSLQL
jgi:hypothetical protein